ncbi:MAG: hypothetical protein KKE93_01575 [Nanoarchaeota archaeon]|nr:hypothetical protein [Nanoarchaeota archaeon]
MSKVCHECGRNVENPFYSASAVLRDTANKRLAFSNLELSLCNSDFEEVRTYLHPKAEEMEADLGIAVDNVTGACGGLTGSVQISSGVYDRHGQYQFLDRSVATQKLPKSTRDLFANPRWFEPTGNGEWKKAQWATKLYKQLSK